MSQRQYLVTARHVVEGLSSPGTIKLFHNNQWNDIQVQPIWCNDPSIDIAVLAPPQQLSPPLKLEPTCGGIVNGQDVYFLGFPYGKFTDHNYLLNNFPFPFVKKAVLSALTGGAKGVNLLFLDGHNNPGFSGGPIVFTEFGKNEYKVAGVISGFNAVEEPVLDGGNPTAMTWMYNTGIIIGYDIKYAVDAIKSNPIGYPLPSS
jgi:prepilin-type processing-associated H-X9-DG protein